MVERPNKDIFAQGVLSFIEECPFYFNVQV